MFEIGYAICEKSEALGDFCLTSPHGRKEFSRHQSCPSCQSFSSFQIMSVTNWTRLSGLNLVSKASLLFTSLTISNFNFNHQINVISRYLLSLDISIFIFSIFGLTDRPTNSPGCFGHQKTPKYANPRNLLSKDQPEWLILVVWISLRTERGEPHFQCFQSERECSGWVTPYQDESCAPPREYFIRIHGQTLWLDVNRSEIDDDWDFFHWENNYLNSFIGIASYERNATKSNNSKFIIYDLTTFLSQSFLWLQIGFTILNFSVKRSNLFIWAIPEN